MSKHKRKTMPINYLKHRELNKAYYTKDKNKALQILLEAEKAFPNETRGIDGAYLCGISYTEDEKTEILENRHKNEDYNHLQERGFAYYGNSFESYKNYLMVEIYIDNLIETANKASKDNHETFIYLLLDEVAKIHKDVLKDRFLDTIFEGEYNNYIADKLQEKIDEVSKSKYKPIDEQLRELISKPLTWNANKNTIGTLFGLLKDKGIVTGTAKDISKALSGMFANLSETTLMDNVNLSVNTSQQSNKYDTETERILKTEWLPMLEKQIKKDKKKTP